VPKPSGARADGVRATGLERYNGAAREAGGCERGCAVLKPYTGQWTDAQSALRVWYATELGSELHARVAARIEACLRRQYALHCVQIGGTQRGVDLLAGRALIHRIHVTGDGADGMRADPLQLPLASRSVDLVLLVHVLEFCPDPHGLLREVDRVLKLDGHVLAVGFNPWSLFGLRRLVGRSRVPWSGHFYSPGRVDDWFGLLGLRRMRSETVWLRPPVQRRRVRQRLAVLDRLAPLMPRLGAVYLLLGRKHSIPFTRIPAAWERKETIPAGRVVRPTQYGETEWPAR